MFIVSQDHQYMINTKAIKSAFCQGNSILIDDYDNHYWVYGEYADEEQATRRFEELYYTIKEQRAEFVYVLPAAPVHEEEE